MPFIWEECREGHVLLGLVLTTIAVVLLALTTFSTPYIHSLYFLRTGSGAGGARFGVLGYCLDGGEECVKRLGYEVDGGEVVGWLERALVCFPIGESPLSPPLLSFSRVTARGSRIADREKRFLDFWDTLGFASLALVSLLVSLCRMIPFSDPRLFRSSSLAAFLFSTLAEVFALVLWIKAKGRYKARGEVDVGYGPALWIGLAVPPVVFLALVLGGPAWEGTRMYRAHRGVAYNV